MKQHRIKNKNENNEERTCFEKKYWTSL